MRPAPGLAVVLLVALFVRTIHLSEKSFWLDEAATLQAVHAPTVGDLLDQVRDVEIGKGPIYYLILRGWTSVFGSGEAAVRLPSAIFGSLAALAVAWWGLVLWRRTWPGLLAGMTVALHPHLVSLSREARAYSLSHMCLFLAAALLAVAYFSHAGPGRRRLAGLGAAISAALAVSCHLFSGFFAVAAYAVTFWLVRADRDARRRLYVDLAVFGALLLVQVPLVLAQVERHYQFAAPAPTLTFRDVGHYLILVAGGKPAGFALAAAALAGAYLCRTERAVRLAAGVLIVALGAVLLIEITPVSIMIGGSRYLAWLAAPMALAAGGLLVVRTPLRIAGAALLVAALVAGLFAARADEHRFSEDWRAVARLLEAEVREGDRVVCHGGHVARPLALYYFAPVEGAVRPREGRRFPVLAPYRETIEAGGRVFLVWSHAGAFDDLAREHVVRELGPPEVVLEQAAIRVLRIGPR